MILARRGLRPIFWVGPEKLLFHESLIYISFTAGSDHWAEGMTGGPNALRNSGRVVFAVTSVLLNAYIVTAHFVRPVHPKFTVLLASRIAIRIHLWSGAVEVVAPLFAFLTTNEDLGRTAMWIALAAELLHASTVHTLYRCFRLNLRPCCFTLLPLKLQLLTEECNYSAHYRPSAWHQRPSA